MDSMMNDKINMYAFCKICLDLDITAISVDRYGHAARFADIQGAASAGCTACDILEQGLSHFAPQIPSEDVVRIYPSDKERRHGPMVVLCHPGVTPLDALRLEFYTLPGHPSIWPAVGSARHKHTDPTDSKCIEFMSKWLHDCRTNHSKCTKAAPTLPTRVIDISTSNLYLYETRSECALYVALSHCWGKTQIATTTRANFEQRKQAISMDSLPRTFQDAIKVTKGLGIRYIWIDSLCIIQDSEDDWAIEASRMCSVYSNAAVTIAADGSSDGTGGLSPPAILDEGRSTPFVVQPRCKENDSPIFVRIHGNCSDYGSRRFLSDQPLSRRAWTYQEALLSPNILHFTTAEVVWECNTCFRCECRVKSSSYSGRNDATHENQRFSWRLVVEDFTNRELTYETDRLPAISGIARAKGNAATDYFCGHWRDELLPSLCWVRRWYRGRAFPSHRHKDYYAPTWAWSSITCSVYMGIDHYKPHLVMSEVLEVHCELATKNSFGHVRSGHIRIQGPTFKVFVDPPVYDERVKMKPEVDSGEHELLDLSWHMTVDVNEPCFEFDVGEPLLALLLVTDTPPKGTNEGLGIVLRECHGTPGTYKRIGRIEVSTIGTATRSVWNHELLRRSSEILTVI